MDAKELFAKAVQQATTCIRHVRPEHLDNETPCREWDVRALLNHMAYELLWVPELIKGKTVQEVGDRFDGDVLHSDIRTSWQHAADAALVAVHGADTSTVAHLSYGDVPVTDYIKEVAGDIFIHTWDLAQGIRCTLIFDDQIAQAVYDNLLPRKEAMAKSALYGDAVPVADDAPLQTKLLGLTGRSAEKWQAGLQI